MYVKWSNLRSCFLKYALLSNVDALIFSRSLNPFNIDKLQFIEFITGLNNETDCVILNVMGQRAYYTALHSIFIHEAVLICSHT